jgi:hypothetical protein
MAVAPILPRAQRHEMPEEADRRWSIFPPSQVENVVLVEQA